VVGRGAEPVSLPRCRAPHIVSKSLSQSQLVAAGPYETRGQQDVGAAESVAQDKRSTGG